MCTGVKSIGQPQSTGNIAMPAMGTCTARTNPSDFWRFE